MYRSSSYQRDKSRKFDSQLKEFREYREYVNGLNITEEEKKHMIENKAKELDLQRR